MRLRLLTIVRKGSEVKECRPQSGYTLVRANHAHGASMPSDLSYPPRVQRSVQCSTTAGHLDRVSRSETFIATTSGSPQCSARRDSLMRMENWTGGKSHLVQTSDGGRYHRHARDAAGLASEAGWPQPPDLLSAQEVAGKSGNVTAALERLYHAEFAGSLAPFEAAMKRPA